MPKKKNKACCVLRNYSFCNTYCISDSLASNINKLISCRTHLVLHQLQHIYLNLDCFKKSYLTDKQLSNKVLALFLRFLFSLYTTEQLTVSIRSNAYRIIR